MMPVPLTVSCFSKIQIGFTFLVTAYPGTPRQRAVKRVHVCNATKCLNKIHQEGLMLDATTTSPSRVHAVSCVRDVVDDNTKK